MSRKEKRETFWAIFIILLATAGVVIGVQGQTDTHIILGMIMVAIATALLYIKLPPKR